jgi:GntR family transcriptional regulator, arabinose operon transcriptional repressor
VVIRELQDSNNMLSLADRTAIRLRDDIRSGKYVVGQRLDDEHSLAKKLKVSRGTIRQALNVLRTERLVVRHQGRGTFITNPAYGPIGNTQTSLLGFMAYDREYFGKIIEGASARAASQGYMLVTGSNVTVEEEKKHIEAFLKSGLKGVIISPHPNTSSEMYSLLHQAGISLVTLDTTFSNYQEDFVGPDDYKGILMATQCLINLGHKKLAYLGHDVQSDIPCRLNRQRGFYDACEQAGIEVLESWIIQANENDYTTNLMKLLDNENRPTGIVCFNDIWAIRIIDVARNLGLNSPEDISVVGFDDSELARNCDTPLTTIRPDFVQIGQAAIDLLISKIENTQPRSNRSILIMPSIVIRKSTAKLLEKS